MYTREDAILILQKIDCEIAELRAELGAIDQRVEDDLDRLMKKYEAKFSPDTLKELKQKYSKELNEKKASAINMAITRLELMKKQLAAQLGQVR